MSDSNVIITHGLRKSYGKVQALRGVDIDVKCGEIFGFLGPNGSGKTTLIRCLLDLIRPNGGKIYVLGIDPQADPIGVRALVGYLPGELHFYGNMTVKQVLTYFNRLRGNKADLKFLNQLVERLDIDMTKRIKNLSKGNKQKIGIIQAFMHRPKLLLLDEPTNSLDPLIQQEVYHLLTEAQDNGATVFFSSHIISEVQTVAERVGIIRSGRLVEVTETSVLINHSYNRARVVFRNPVDSSTLEDVRGVTILSQDSKTNLLLQIEGEMDGLIKALAAYPVTSFETERPSLEEIFLSYFKTDKI